MPTIGVERVAKLQEAVPREPRALDGETPCKPCAVRRAASSIGLERIDLAQLRAIATPLNFAPGQAIFHEGEPAERIYCVTAGTIRMVKLMADGRRQITGFLFPGDLLGLAEDNGYAYGAEAVTSCSVFCYPMARLQMLMFEHVGLERKLCAIARHELAEAQDQILLLGRKTARERVASFLLMLSRRAALRGKSQRCLAISMTRDDMADYLGVATETISRTLTEFRNEGLICTGQSKNIELRNPDALTEIAEGLA